MIKRADLVQAFLWMALFLSPFIFLRYWLGSPT